MRGADPFSGAVLVFRSRRADRIKILVRDGSGLVLVWKLLEASVFRWPAIVDGMLCVDETAMPVLDPGRGKTKKGHAWAIARGDRPWGGANLPAVVFHYHRRAKSLFVTARKQTDAQ